MCVMGKVPPPLPFFIAVGVLTRCPDRIGHIAYAAIGPSWPADCFFYIMNHGDDDALYVPIVQASFRRFRFCFRGPVTDIILLQEFRVNAPSDIHCRRVLEKYGRTTD